jgi:tyrosine-protein phosphatase YwqE
MFSIFKSKEKQNFLKELQVDIHSHLIPAIDDGAKTIEHSIKYIKRLKELGYKKLITTPHIITDSYPNNKLNILQGLYQLKRELKAQNIDIELEAAAEHYLDEDFLNKLEKNEVLPIRGGYLLFETSYMFKPLNLEDIIYNIKLSNFKPIFAHPERYRYIKDLEAEYKSLKDLGVYFQLDINSLNGYYGKDAMHKANFLIEAGYVDFLGSDTHHSKHIDNLFEVTCNSKIFKNLYNKNKILNSSLL